MIASDNDITLFAKTNFRNREVPFGIRRDDRRRHMYVIGKTGMGKTTLIENMVIQDIINGHGLCFVDPHGDSVEKVLNYIPANRINDVIYLNPADMDFPIAFNPLEAVDPRQKHLVASGLMGVFTKIWAGVWSARMEHILNNTILALLDSPGNTMMGIVRMYVDKTYRKKIVDNIKDPVVKSYWTDEFANYQDKFKTEAIAPIQNKVGQFLSNAIIRNIVGQTKSSIDLRDIMDNKKILLLNLSKGRIGEDSSALLGAMIITKLQLAAMSRVDIPEEQRADFYLYVDEFQNFATESFASILSEARKYRLNLIVAHQYIGQLIQDKSTIVRDAIFGNVGTMITFRVGADDAEFLEKEFEPTYTMNDLVNLTKYQIYLKLMINGVASQPFSAATLPPIAEATGNEDKVVRVSRERYGTPVEIVEQKISKWLGAEFHTAAAKSESESMDEEGAEENFRFRHESSKGESRPASASAMPARESSFPAPAPKIPSKAMLKSDPELAEPKAEQKLDLKPEPKPYSPPDIKVHTPQSKAGNTKYEPKPQPDRRNIERRVRNVDTGSQRRHTDSKQEDKPEKKKHENPIWDTVSKMTTEKLAESATKTTSALEALSKSLQQSVSKEFKKPEAPKPQQPKPEQRHEQPKHRQPERPSEVQKAPEPVAAPTPAPKIQVPEAVFEHKPFKPIEPAIPSVVRDESGIPGILPRAQVEEIPPHKFDANLPDHHVHPSDPAESPHVNVQDTISRHGQLAPGQTVRFDD